MNIQHVMLVDDDANIRKLAALSLERVGKWSVTSVCSGAEAVEQLPFVKPDLVILDVMMPGMDGIATLKAIKQNEEYRRLPVILMTAKVQGEECEGYVALGAAGVIVKPFDPMQLPNQIKELLSNKMTDEATAEEAITDQ